MYKPESTTQRLFKEIANRETAGINRRLCQRLVAGRLSEPDQRRFHAARVKVTRSSSLFLDDVNPGTAVAMVVWNFVRGFR